jgi:hypothetical protein
MLLISRLLVKKKIFTITTKRGMLFLIGKLTRYYGTGKNGFVTVRDKDSSKRKRLQRLGSS